MIDICFWQLPNSDPSPVKIATAAWTARKDWVKEANGRPGEILGAHLWTAGPRGLRRLVNWQGSWQYVHLEIDFWKSNQGEEPNDGNQGSVDNANPPQRAFFSGSYLTWKKNHDFLCYCCWMFGDCNHAPNSMRPSHIHLQKEKSHHRIQRQITFRP